MEVSKKIIVVGHFGVGKTSLIKQFVYEKFSDQYLTTIGVKIDKKLVEIEGAKLNLILWDIAGEQSVSKIPKNYFMGAHGMIYVFDLTREETYQNIEDEIFSIAKENSQMESVVLGNKSDLVSREFIEEVQSEIPIKFKITSAMTGENVEEAFISLAKSIL
ncbi:Rab family GTPase [Ekhidna sp.]|uniref:Rab family GTPase n=1 Tax=Ekhidna sp. TaxID=2608089 RepID=UPI003298BE19